MHADKKGKYLGRAKGVVKTITLEYFFFYIQEKASGEKNRRKK